MPISVAAAFTQFYENINLDGDYRAMANTRRDDIIKKLSKDFEIIESFSTGSIPKYTALKGSADLDVMVALHFTKHIKDRAPTQVLQVEAQGTRGGARTKVDGVRSQFPTHYQDDQGVE